MKTALMFSGQGTQHPGMMGDLFEAYGQAREVFDKASSLLGRDIYDITMNSAQEELDRTENTQPCLLACELAALRVPIDEWKAKEKPAAVRGFALARQAGMEMEEALQAGYLSYIRRQRKRLYSLAVGHEEVLRLMIAEKMIPKKDVSLLLDEAEARQNAAAKALILEYGRKL